MRTHDLRWPTANDPQDQINVFEADAEKQTWAFDISVTDPDTDRETLEVEVEEVNDDEKMVSEVEILSAESGYSIQFVRMCRYFVDKRTVAAKHTELYG